MTFDVTACIRERDGYTKVRVIEDDIDLGRIHGSRREVVKQAMAKLAERGVVGSDDKWVTLYVENDDSYVYFCYGKTAHYAIKRTEDGEEEYFAGYSRR